MLKTCIHCEIEFDLLSPEKKRAGGKATECPDCSEETTIKYLGTQSSDGKMAQANILKFDSEEDRKKYLDFWQNNSGLFKGKSAQLGKHLSTDPKIKFQTVVAAKEVNHKGKA